MLSLGVCWDAQADGFDLDEPGSRREAEALLDEGPKVSERSEFFGPQQS